MGSNTSPQARLLFKDAFDKLEQTISANHPVEARSFHSMTIQDVRTAAKQIEQELAARQCLRNMRRIEPFFAGLEQYSKAVDVLCNGTPFLPWIWAPVKLVLQLASDFTTAIEKLVSAYGQIGDALPRFDRLSAAFQDNPDFQRVVATVYADILDFHREAYRFFRKQGWKIFFKTLWAGFDLRFKGILDSLARHSELVDKEANSIDIAEAKGWRSKLLEDTMRKEQERSVTQLRTTLSWLEVKDDEQIEQEDELDRQYSLHHDHSCDWIQKNPKARSWMRLGRDELVLWLNGKPGSGKTVLSSIIIRFLQQDKNSIVLYYFCNYHSSSFKKNSHVLRSLVAQLLRHNKDLSAYVYDEYVCQGLTSSVPQLKKLIPMLLSSFPSARIVIDGLDEFEERDQSEILNGVLSFASASDIGAVCKVLIASRDIAPISKRLSKRSTISLSGTERSTVDAAIQSFVHHSLIDVRRDIRDMNVDNSIMTEVENGLIEKADGMFLWVRLVLSTLGKVHSIQQLSDAIRELPTGLHKIYDRIINRINQQLDARDRGKAIRILEWVAMTKRRLKKIELLDGVSLHRDNSQLNEKTRLWEQVIDLCKPFVEDGPNGTIVFIHFTVREYLLESSDNTLIRPVDAHHDISFACLAYLRTGLDLVDPYLPEEERMVRVGKGFHALQLYAYEYWATHLLTYANLNGGLRGRASQPLVEQLVGLCEDHEQIKSQLSRAPNARTESLTAGADVQDLRHLGDLEAREIVQVTLGLRKLLKNEPCKTGGDAEDYERAKDPTIFSEVLHSYKKILHHLLRAKAFPGLSHEQLAWFKQHFRSSAFVCRFRGCPRATDGYSTELEREDHETLRHTGGIKCKEVSCSWSRIGFKTSAALKSHMAKYHPSPESVRKPSVLRRKYICGEPTSNGPLWGCGQRFAQENDLQRHLESPAGQICQARFHSDLDSLSDTFEPSSPVQVPHAMAQWLYPSKKLFDDDSNDSVGLSLQPNGHPQPGVQQQNQVNLTSGEHALEGHHLQLKSRLLEARSKKRLWMARQEQDNLMRSNQPGVGQPGFQDMLPQGNRAGPSPDPSDQTSRGTPRPLRFADLVASSLDPPLTLPPQFTNPFTSQPTEYPEVSSAAPSPYLNNAESFDSSDRYYSPLLAPQPDTAAYQDALGIEPFRIYNPRFDLGSFSNTGNPSPPVQVPPAAAQGLYPLKRPFDDDSNDSIGLSLQPNGYLQPGVQQQNQVNPIPEGRKLEYYQMQLQLLELKNKRRLLATRQEQDNLTRYNQPGVGQPGFQGSRASPSPDHHPQPVAQQQNQANPTPRKHEPNDYEMKLMLLEAQNKKRLLIARQEQDNLMRSDQPGVSQPGFRGMSPQGNRAGPSPDPLDRMEPSSPITRALTNPFTSQPTAVASAPASSPAPPQPDQVAVPPMDSNDAQSNMDFGSPDNEDNFAQEFDSLFYGSS